jgi:hypothetical protein
MYGSGSGVAQSAEIFGQGESPAFQYLFLFPPRQSGVCGISFHYAVHMIALL